MQEPRKHYDLSKVTNEGRKKYENSSSLGKNGSPTQQSVFIEELIEWLKNSKHGKDSPNAEQNEANKGAQSIGYGSEGIYAKQEIMKLQALYYEERRKCSDLQSTVYRLERRNEELEKLLG